MASKKKTNNDNLIIENKKARFSYHIEERLEAGIVLQGWEVKSLRSGRVQLVDSHIIIKDNQAWLIGALINPLPTVSTHVIADPTRTRKLLLHRAQIDKLAGLIERKGYTLVPLKLYWHKNRTKVSIALAKGKKLHDKRETIKARDWAREKSRVLKKTR